MNIKSILGKVVVVLLVLFAIMLAISIISSPSEDTSEKPEETQVVEYEEAKQEEVEKNQDSKEAIVLGELRGELGHVFNIQYDDFSQTYYFDPYDEDTIRAVIEGYAHEEWNSFVESLRMVSMQIQSELGDGYSIKMRNPDNDTLILVDIIDGEIDYNFTEKY